MQSQRIHTKAYTKLNRVLWFFLCSSPLASAENPWAWMVEPSFMDYKVQRPIVDSERTILALVRIRNGEIYGVEGARDHTVALAMKEIELSAQHTAQELLDSIIPQFVRDKNGVIQYAILESKNPLTASAVLAPKFTEIFSSTLGPDLLVALPNRFQILVFSRQDQAFQKMGESIIASYLSSNYPVSREIFALEQGQLRSIGVLE